MLKVQEDAQRWACSLWLQNLSCILRLQHVSSKAGVEGTSCSRCRRVSASATASLRWASRMPCSSVSFLSALAAAIGDGFSTKRGLGSASSPPATQTVDWNVSTTHVFRLNHEDCSAQWVRLKMWDSKNNNYNLKHGIVYQDSAYTQEVPVETDCPYIHQRW